MTLWMVNPAGKAGRTAISRRIALLVREGKTQRQAAGEAYSEARAGRLGMPAKRTATKRRTTTKRAAPRKRRRTTTTKRRPTKRRTKRTTRRRTNPGGRKVATRKRRRTPTRRKTTRRRTTTTARKRRTYRRNPKPKVLRKLQDGLVGAVYAVGGKAAARIVASKVPMPGGMVIGGIDVGNILVQGGTAVALGLVADRVLPARHAEEVVIGALMGPVESAIRGANIPVVSAALSSYPQPLTPRSLRMVPVRTPRGRLGSYVQPRPAALAGYVQPPRAVPAMRALSGAGLYNAGYN